MRTRVARLGTLVAALVIALATLVPAGGRDAGPPLWCLVCGERLLADAIRNLLLFLPLGVLLRLAGRPFTRAIAAATLLSLAIEMIQILIPGRDPSLADLAANTLGAALGAAIAGAPAAWRSPSRARAALLAAGWCALVSGVVATGRVLESPSLPASQYYGQWAPRLGHLAWYGGVVRQAALGDRPLHDGPLDSTLAVRAALLGGRALSVEAAAGPPPAALAPIFSIADERGREIVLVGAEREDLVLRYRMRAAWLRLEQPSLRFRGVLRQLEPGADLSIRAAPIGRDACLEVNGRRRCPGFSVFTGWAFVVPEFWLGPAARQAASVLWASCLVVPACYWLMLALRRPR